MLRVRGCACVVALLVATLWPFGCSAPSPFDAAAADASPSYGGRLELSKCVPEDGCTPLCESSCYIYFGQFWQNCSGSLPCCRAERDIVMLNTGTAPATYRARLVNVSTADFFLVPAGADQSGVVEVGSMARVRVGATASWYWVPEHATLELTTSTAEAPRTDVDLSIGGGHCDPPFGVPSSSGSSRVASSSSSTSLSGPSAPSSSSNGSSW